MATSKRGGLPWPLIILLASFLVPATIAWTLFFGGWRPDSTGNHGELVTPPQRLEGRVLDESGALVDLSTLRGKWTILIHSRGPCDDLCLARLIQTRQARLALAQRSTRSRRVLLLPEDAPGLTEEQKAAHPGLAVYRRVEPLLPENDAYADEPIHVSLVDTRGYRMMAYPEPLDAGGLLEDMKRLLRLSNLDLEQIQGLTEED